MELKSKTIVIKKDNINKYIKKNTLFVDFNHNQRYIFDSIDFNNIHFRFNTDNEVWFRNCNFYGNNIIEGKTSKIKFRWCYFKEESSTHTIINGNVSTKCSELDDNSTLSLDANEVKINSCNFISEAKLFITAEKVSIFSSILQKILLYIKTTELELSDVKCDNLRHHSIETEEASITDSNIKKINIDAKLIQISNSITTIFGELKELIVTDSTIILHHLNRIKVLITNSYVSCGDAYRIDAVDSEICNSSSIYDLEIKNCYVHSDNLEIKNLNIDDKSKIEASIIDYNGKQMQEIGTNKFINFHRDRLLQVLRNIRDLVNHNIEESYNNKLRIISISPTYSIRKNYEANIRIARHNIEVINKRMSNGNTSNNDMLKRLYETISRNELLIRELDIKEEKMYNIKKNGIEDGKTKAIEQTPIKKLLKRGF